MNRTRFVLGVLLIVGVPPAILYWLMIHPFVRFWRRIGPKPTCLVAGVLFCSLVVVLFRTRAGLLGSDLGTNWTLILLGCIPALLLVVILEERERRDRFGREYEDYRARVPAILPTIGSKPENST